MAETSINFGVVVVVTADKDFAVLVADALRASGANVGDLKVRAPDKLSDELLDVQDPDLWDWVMGHATAPRADWQAIIDDIRARHRL